MSETAFDFESVTNWEQFQAAFNAGVPMAHLCERTPFFRRKKADLDEFHRIAIPLYRADYGGHPWYRDKDDQFWKSFIGSQWVLAQERVAAHLAGLPWPPTEG